ncbi:MAG TPA: hypothetical protein VGD88_12965 [Opitutaceae bacterium]
MAEEQDPTSGKKHRIIHWNPDVGNQPEKRRWTPLRIAAFALGGFVGLIVAGRIIVETSKLVFGPDVFKSAAVSEAGPVAASDPGSVFVSRSKAELARENVSKALAEMRRLPQDHPQQLQKLILIEKAYIGGESLIDSGDYARAFNHFDALGKEIDEFGRLVKVKQEAQQAYDTVLLKIKELDRARSLAPEALDAAFAAAGVGRQFLSEGSFDAAKKTFDDAFAELKRAETVLGDFIASNLRDGQEALSRGDRDGAARAFQAALEKSPGNELALQGLNRSRTIDRVYALLGKAKGLEDQKRYAEAAAAYGEAFALDAFSATAQQGQSRAARLEKETQFNAAFTAAQEAFNRRDWERAITEGQNALKVYPDKKDVADMVKSARENSHQDAVASALAKAYEHENKFEWVAAREAYDQTMKLSPDHADAKEGYARAGKVIRALLQYERSIDEARERADRAEFQAGIRSFNEAMAIKPDYLVNSPEVEQLRATLMAQSQPVDVNFTSDGKTWVSISNYRMLGQFANTSVKILPGDYEIIGRRKGYQDVLLLLQVRNGSQPPTVAVTCNLKADK